MAAFGRSIRPGGLVALLVALRAAPAHSQAAACRPTSMCNRTAAEGGCPASTCDAKAAISTTIIGDLSACMQACTSLGTASCGYFALQGTGSKAQCTLFDVCSPVLAQAGSVLYMVPDSRPWCNATTATNSTGSTTGAAKLAPIWQDVGMLRDMFANLGVAWQPGQAGLTHRDVICAQKRISCSDSGYVLDLSSLGLTAIPDAIPQLRGIVGIHACCNALSSFPDGFWNLTQMQDLQVDQNNFTGSLHAGIGQFTKLTTLIISENSFSGTLPAAALGSLTKLTKLDIKRNNFTGGVDFLCSMKKLSTFDAEDLHLSGTLPACLENFTKMSTFDIKFSAFAGPLPNISSWPGAKLEFSGNLLSGTIPDVWGSMQNLVRIYLDHNQFSPPLPPSLVSKMALPVVNAQVDLALFDCQLGEEPMNTTTWKDGGAGVCRPCSPGTFRNALDVMVCAQCPPGSFAAGAASLTCQACASGRFADSSGTSSCAVCPAGTRCGESTVTPAPCPAGWYGPEAGGSECFPCPLGRYAGQVGSSSCTLCQAGLTTGGSGTNDASLCVCPEDSYRVLGNDSEACAPCPGGMQCKVGSDLANLGVDGKPYPEALAGFMTQVRAPLKAFLCKSSGMCPGGAPGTCGQNRDATAVACGNCLEGWYDVDTVCVPCIKGGSKKVVAGLLIAAAFICTCAATLLVNQEVSVQRNATTLCVVVVGLGIASLQTLSVYHKMDVHWLQPLGEILRRLDIFNFDLEVIGMSCVLGSDSVRRYGAQQLIAPCTIPVVLLTVMVKHRCRMGTKAWLEVCNAVGTIFSIFFISIVVSASSSVMCYDHPAGNGASLLTMPSVLCFQGEAHPRILLIGGLSLLLVPLPFFAMSSYGVAVYPSLVATTDMSKARRLRAFRFLFHRYRPMRYYYGLLHLLRGLLVAFVPVVADLPIQVCVMCALLLLFFGLVQRLQPWRGPGSNLADALGTCALILLVLCGALMMELRASARSIQVLALIFLALCAAVVLAFLLWALLLRLVPRPYYRKFICHHKAHAAAQARLLKMLLVARTGHAIFIDSDDLQDLDVLFDIVRCWLENLIVYLTRDTLTRPWCAGEIVTATRAGVRITLVMTATFREPTEEEYGCIEDYLDLSSCSLSQYGISLGDVGDAYRKVFQGCYAVFSFNGVGGSRRFEALADAVVSGDVQARLSCDLEVINTSCEQLVVSSDPSSDEATAAASILVSKIGQALFSAASLDICRLSDCKPDLGATELVMGKCLAAIVLLSAGSMECLPQLWAIAEVVRAAELDSSVVVVPVNLPDFVFPGPMYYDEVLPRVWDSTFPASLVKELIAAFFRRITIHLATHASNDVLDAQARLVLQRLPCVSDKGCRSASLGKAVSKQSSRGTSSVGAIRSSRSTDQGMPTLVPVINMSNNESVKDLRSLQRKPAKKLEAEAVPQGLVSLDGQGSGNHEPHTGATQGDGVLSALHL